MKATVERDQGKRRGNDAIVPAGQDAVRGTVPARRLQRLQQAIGNQGVQRVVEARLIQRDDDEATDDGTLTIEEPQSDPYDVSGTTLAEVHSQLDPTEWGRCTYHYDYDYDTTNGRTTRVNVTLRLTIRLPRWQEGRADASDAARTEWDRMMGALRTHENGHADIAREWAPTVRERLLGVQEGNVASRYSQVRGQVQTRQDEYDTQTQHGQTQGVSLDLSVDQEEAEGEAGTEEETEVEAGE
jgi:predicted secreted Zn-dependent protease